MSTIKTNGEAGELPLSRASGRSCPGMPRVLLAVADVNVAQVMKSSLDRGGFEVDTALTEDVGLLLYRDVRHAAIIIDQGERSDALAERLLEQSGDHVPFILLIGEATQPALAAPTGTERLEKPVSLRYVVARLTGEFGYFAM